MHLRRSRASFGVNSLSRCALGICSLIHLGVQKTVGVDAQLVRSLLRELVAIDSVNPTLVPGARGEAAAAEFLHEYLQRQGIAAELREAAPGRPNTVALIGGEAQRGAAGSRAH